MRYAQVLRIGVTLALAATLLHSLPAWAQTPHGSETYRDPNPEAEGGRVKCSDAGPMKKYLKNIENRQKVLGDALTILNKKLVEARKKQKAAQKEFDEAIKEKRSHTQRDLAQEELEAAINDVLNIEGEIRAKQSELDRIPRDKANTLADIRRLCDGLPGETGGCVTDNSKPGAGTCR